MNIYFEGQFCSSIYVNEGQEQVGLRLTKENMSYKLSADLLENDFEVNLKGSV